MLSCETMRRRERGKERRETERDLRIDLTWTAVCEAMDAEAMASKTRPLACRLIGVGKQITNGLDWSEGLALVPAAAPAATEEGTNCSSVDWKT
jgi:hypothetical protein